MERLESKPDVWNQVSGPYVTFVEPFLGKFSDFAVGELMLRGNLERPSLVDVACGPGTSTIRAADLCVSIDALDFSVEMVGLCKSRTEGSANVTVHQGDGQSLPFADNSYDLGISMFGLIFFPDRIAGLSELGRVVRSGGWVSIGAWAPFERSELFMTIITALAPSFPELAEVERPDPGMSDISTMRTEMESVFEDVDIREVELAMDLDSAESLWLAIRTSFAGLSQFLDGIPEDRMRAEMPNVVERFRALGDGPISLNSVAYVGFGKVR